MPYFFVCTLVVQHVHPQEMNINTRTCAYKIMCAWAALPTVPQWLCKCEMLCNMCMSVCVYGCVGCASNNIRLGSYVCCIAQDIYQGENLVVYVNPNLSTAKIDYCNSSEH